MVRFVFHFSWLFFLANVLFFTSLGQLAAAPLRENLPTVQLETSAESAILMDENGAVLFAKDPHKPLPPASVTKAMTLLLAVEAVEQKIVNLDDSVSTSGNAWRQGGSQIWLAPGEIMTLRQLMTAVAVVSANDAAVAVMENIYGSEASAVAAMNMRAAELGLKDTHFVNVNGLPAPGHVMSAYDTALIVREAVRHPLYMELCNTKEHWLRDGKNWLVNTNKLLWWYKGADGLKTGWTQDAKYCFAGTAKRDGLRLISVVFATPEPRSHFRESMKLMDWGFARFTAVPVADNGAIIEWLNVTRGIDKEVPLVTKDNLLLVLPKGEEKKLQKKIISERTVSAPITQGEKYGEMVVYKEGTEVGRVDLVAERSVPKAGFMIILRSMLANLLTISR
jgi:serine-type D-Ala-D-Ala carboxypeptidase (penicillin-binding protein 5/6)